MAAGCTIKKLETSVRGLVLKLSDKVTLTKAFTARKNSWSVMMVVLAAVSQNGDALRHTSVGLRAE